MTGKALVLYTLGKVGAAGAICRAKEFCDPAIGGLPTSARSAISTVAVEAGAKNGFVAPDDATMPYRQDRIARH